jgi:hypothetical protein
LETLQRAGGSKSGWIETLDDLLGQRRLAPPEIRGRLAGRHNASGGVARVTARATPLRRRTTGKLVEETNGTNVSAETARAVIFGDNQNA